MQLLRKTVALILICVLVLSLTACAPGGKKDDRTEREKLIGILDDIKENVHPGTAGGTLRAMRTAADLISWASSTTMKKSEAAKVVKEWLKEQSPEMREVLQEKLEQVAEACGSIIREEAKGALESAGVEEKFSDISSRVKDLVDSVLEELRDK